MASVSFEVLIPPAQEPLTLAEIKAYLRVDYADEDTLIQQFITDAREEAERLTKRALAPQTIRATIEPDRIAEGALSGPIVGGDIDIFRLNERVTSIPFAFYGPVFQLPRAKISAISLVEYQLTPFDNPEWTTLDAQDSNGNPNYRLDGNTDPNRIVIMPMLVANRYRFTYSAGYDLGKAPRQIINAMKALISFWYDNRQGEAIPDSIINELARARVWEL